MAYVQTTDGIKVYGWSKDDPKGSMTMEAAQASAQERNVRAEELGVKARYEAAE